MGQFENEPLVFKFLLSVTLGKGIPSDVGKYFLRLGPDINIYFFP